ncbi:MAG: glucosamine-6-phosphate deaminase [Saprospiraceae bacterium]
MKSSNTITKAPVRIKKSDLERIDLDIYDSSADASMSVAERIAEIIRDKAAKGEQCVLGLATGSTPVSVYEHLVRMHQEEGLSFKNVVTFNLDEYYPVDPRELQSYVRFMREHLFDRVDIPTDQWNVPDGTIPRNEVDAYCVAYEQRIKDAGGIDLQLLGIGRTGHIGFNEPGSGRSSRTRLISLDHITITDAASDFFGEENVPRKAITMGVGSILDARELVLMAWGEGKAPIVKEAVEGPLTDSIPATYLQEHNNVKVILDEASSAKLTRIDIPWTIQTVKWTKEITHKAVLWLSRIVELPLLKLTNRHYAEHGMGDLLALEEGGAYDINLRIFGDIQKTITGWPGGKPNSDKNRFPERPQPEKKRVIIFSPHPDDDVISMGGTFIRLVDQGHEVHVAYQTSGNIAVFDEDVVRFADFAADYTEAFDLAGARTADLLSGVREAIANKIPGEVDSPSVQSIKGLIRRGEAKAACRYVGIPDDRMHFQDLPFYETGKVRKSPLGPMDIQITVDLLNKVKPHQVFAAGDLSDPHGTHRTCLNAVFQAMEVCKKESWSDDCWMWLYRGAWQEWALHETDMAVPISPDELLRKRRAIFKHQSQKDRPLFPGHDAREFWQRAEQRNRATAKAYDDLGMAEYEAIEAFRRWHF